MRLREHPAIGEGRTDILPADPRLLSIIPGYNVRDLTTPEAREELDELKAKVKAHGVRTALVVKFDGEKIWIIEGHKRHKVAMELINEYEASEGREGATSTSFRSRQRNWARVMSTATSGLRLPTAAPG
jgi:hypothetical protein